MRRRAIAYALMSAVLFGASTPLAKLLVGAMTPLVLAGVLYLGSGIGLGVWLALRRVMRPERAPRLARGDWPWLAAAIAAGGIAGPAFLMYGLARTDAASASLLLNLEAVLTAALAWVVFRENVDRRIFLGMLAIVAGGVLLSWEKGPPTPRPPGAFFLSPAFGGWGGGQKITPRGFRGGGGPPLR